MKLATNKEEVPETEPVKFQLKEKSKIETFKWEDERMNITLKKLEELNACQEARKAFPKKWGKEVDSLTLLKSLRDRNNYIWANWLIVRIMTRKQYLSYAIFSAEQVLDIYEKKYPNEKRPRLAIEAAKKVLEQNTKENKDAAYASASAADAAAYAAYAARKKMQLKILNYGIRLLEVKI